MINIIQKLREKLLLLNCTKETIDLQVVHDLTIYQLT